MTKITKTIDYQIPIPGEATIRLWAEGKFEVRNNQDEVCQTGVFTAPSLGLAPNPQEIDTLYSSWLQLV